MIMKVIYIIPILTACLLQVQCKNKVEGEIHLIPKGYEGPVIIVFNQKTGKPVKYENGSRVYEIPASGVLKTQFKEQEEGYISMDEVKYLYTDNTAREEIKYLQSVADANDSTQNYIFTLQLAKNNIRYLVGRVNKRAIYYDSLQKKLKEVFPPVVMGQ
jgi:hypothetical protein